MPSRPLPDVAGAYLARVIASWESNPDDNLLAWQAVLPPATGTADVAVAQAICDALAARWPAFATATFSTTYSGTEVTCYPLHTPLHPAVSQIMSAPGGQPGDPAPAPVAMLMKHTVVRRGRGSQSHTSFSGFPDSAIESSGKTISVAFASSVDTAWSTMVLAVEADVAAATGVTINFRQLSKIPPGRTFAIDGSVMERALSTQRRRARR